jgi:predicted RNA-binding protein with PUA-like domain
MKSEPEVYAIDDLARDKRTMWDGVRSYQARNSMRDDMRVGDRVLFYHSNADPMGVAGIAEVASAPYPDPTQFDEKSPYHDPTSSRDDPRWILVDVAFVEKFARVVTLAELKAERALQGMMVTARGSRLSVQPVEPKHYERVVSMAAMAPKPNKTSKVGKTKAGKTSKAAKARKRTKASKRA